MSEKGEKRRWPCVCVDLESLDVRPGGRIIEIGAVCFDPRTGELGPSFELEIDPEHADQDARSVDLQTVMWWGERKLEGIVMPGWDLEHSVELWSALDGLRLFLAENTEIRDCVSQAKIWAWGSDFDFPMLRNAYDACHDPLPWKYSKQRDARTFCEELGMKRLGDVKHRALPDAKQEARAIMAAFGKIKVLEQLEQLEKLEREGNPPSPDMEAGWNAYRQEILETMGMTNLPVWKDCPEQLRECWAVGVWAALRSEE